MNKKGGIPPMAYSETLKVARRCAEKDLPLAHRGDWRAFDRAIYKALCNLELMQKLSSDFQQNNDLTIMEAMGLGRDSRNVVRLSILQLQSQKRFIRRSKNPYDFIVSDVLYKAVINRGVKAASRVGQLLKT